MRALRTEDVVDACCWWCQVNRRDVVAGGAAQNHSQGVMRARRLVFLILRSDGRSLTQCASLLGYRTPKNTAPLGGAISGEDKADACTIDAFLRGGLR
jgi:hypothetical protein